MPFPRPLTDDERILVCWMLEHGDVDPKPYLDQLDHAVVISTCKCGCASIDFQIGDSLPNPKKGMTIISDYLFGPESPPFGAFLFAHGDMLAGLDIYSFSDIPAPLPRTEDLRPFDTIHTAEQDAAANP